jgi:hypothetical protein
MQLAHTRGIPLYQIFLDLSKAYDTLDRTRTLQILQAYGMGEKMLRVIANFWKSLKVVAKQQGYHGEPFRAERGTRQVDIVSPRIFNIVVNTVIRAWYHKLESEGQLPFPAHVAFSVTFRRYCKLKTCTNTSVEPRAGYLG